MQESDETILDLAESHPEYTAEQFVADFKTIVGRDPTAPEKRNFLKAVKNVKTKPDASPVSSHAPPKVINEYSFCEVVGKGAFGEVYRAKKGGLEYAIKHIDESLLSGDVEQSFAESISARLNSKFVVRYFDKFRGPGGELYVVMEFCQKGDLRSVIDHLKEIQAVLQTPRVLKMMIQLLLALDVLHCNKIIHRDLTPENIFSDKADNIKVGDFGCSKELDTTSMKANTVIGTPLYESPEVIRGEEYDASADMWALGVLLYELCTLERPFQHANRYKLQELILAGQFAPLPVGRYPKEVSEIIQSLLSVNPKQRPTARDLLHHPFIQKYGAELGLLVYFPPGMSKSTFTFTSAPNANAATPITTSVFASAKSTISMSVSASQKAADKAVAERAASERVAAERAAAEKAAAERAAAERVAADRAAIQKEKAAAERAAFEKGAAERTAAKKTPTENPVCETCGHHKKLMEYMDWGIYREAWVCKMCNKCQHCGYIIEDVVEMGYECNYCKKLVCKGCRSHEAICPERKKKKKGGK